MSMERMIVPIEWKADESSGKTLVGYASTFGNVDLGGDVVMPGAFDKTIANIKANGIPLLADHVAATSHVLGTIYDAEADDKGLKIFATVSQAPSVQDTITKAKEGHLNKLSIGYETMDDAYEDRDGRNVRLLKEVKLWETSVVVFPMNPSAAITGVKTLLSDLVEEGVVTPKDFTEDAAAAPRVQSKGNAEMATLDLWKIEYHVEAKTGVPSEHPAPARSDGTPAGSKDASPDEGGASAAPTATGGDEPPTQPDEGAKGSWDKYRSEALLHDRPTGEVDSATRLALQTRLALAESQLPRAD